MFGWLMTFLFGTTYTGAIASDKAAEIQRRDNARKDKSDYYFDRNGRLRHTDTGKKYTSKEVKDTFFNNDNRRIIITNKYNDLINNKRMNVDKDYYTFQDYVFYIFENNKVTGKEIFPELDWDSFDKRHTQFCRPQKLYYGVPDKDDWRTTRIFDTIDEAKLYDSKYNDAKNIVAIINEFLLRNGKDDYSNRLFGRYIIDKTGEEYNYEWTR